MKILSLFIIFAISFLGLSGQDTTIVRNRAAADTSISPGSVTKYVHDTLFIRDEVRPVKLISEKNILHVRNAGIVLSSVGGGFTIAGVGLMVAGIRQDAYGNTNLSYFVGGMSLIGFSGYIHLAGICTWIAYGVKHHKYKKQQEQGDMQPYYYHYR